MSVRIGGPIKHKRCRVCGREGEWAGFCVQTCPSCREGSAAVRLDAARDRLRRAG